jgi:hypothetical protein
VLRNLDTLFERDIITIDTIIQHRQEARKAQRPFSASFGLPVGVLLLGTGINSAGVAVIAWDGRTPRAEFGTTIMVGEAKRLGWRDGILRYALSERYYRRY